MSKFITEKRIKLLGLCKKFLSAELVFMRDSSEVNRNLLDSRKEEVLKNDITLAHARKLAVSKVAEQYVGKK